MSNEKPLEIDPDGLSKLRHNGCAILDVREGWETDLCAIDGSLLIPMQSLPGRLDEVPKDQPLVVLCHYGGRSLQVTQWLRAQGYDRAVSLAGGIDAWARQVDQSLATY